MPKLRNPDPEYQYTQGKLAVRKKIREILKMNDVPINRARAMVANPDSYSKEEVIKALSSINLLVLYITKN